MDTSQLRFDDVTIQKMFGHEAAEDEDPDRLKEYYFKSQYYDRLISKLPLRILVGHKGIGKSAMFRIAYTEDAERHQLAIWIRPDDILGIGEDNNEDFLELIRDWKQGLNRIITNKVLIQLGITDDNNEIVTKAKQFSGKILNFLQDTFKSKLDSDGISFQPAYKALLDNFLKSNSINIYIDDLDRGWKGTQNAIKRISALLNAIRDLANDNRGLYFKVALRSDVYFLVRTADESTDKIEGSVIWLSWTNHEILALFVKRVDSFFGIEHDDKFLINLYQPLLAQHLDIVIEEKFQGRGHWSNAPMYRILMSLIRKRPRDLVKLCTLAAQHAYENGRNRITTTDFESIFEHYSQGRLQDTVNEYRTELKDIERLLMGMKPNKIEQKTAIGFVYATDALLKKIRNVMQHGDFRFANGRLATPQQLAGFLYKINFLTARKRLQNSFIQRKYYEESRYLIGHFADFGYDWEVHPAYRWALKPDTLEDVYKHLELSADDDET